MDRNSIFDYAINNEDAITELLCNLMRFKPFREAVLGTFLKPEIIDTISFNDFTTQYDTGGYGFPDLVISNSQIEVYIEVKVNNTSLTPNQPRKYLESLEKKEQNKLQFFIFLVPRHYTHRKEYQDRLREFLKGHTGKPKIHTNEILWEDIIRVLRGSELQNLSILFQEFLTFLEEWFLFSVRKFSTKEITKMYSKEIPEVLLKLYSLIEAIEPDLISKGYKIGRAKNSSDFGLNVRDADNNQILFFGIWYEYWKEKEVPLCVAVIEKYCDPEFFKKFTDGTWPTGPYDGWMVMDIPKEIVEKEEPKDQLSKQLLKVLDYVTS